MNLICLDVFLCAESGNTTYTTIYPFLGVGVEFLTNQSYVQYFLTNQPSLKHSRG